MIFIFKAFMDLLFLCIPLFIAVHKLECVVLSFSNLHCDPVLFLSIYAIFLVTAFFIPLNLPYENLEFYFSELVL